MSYEMSTQGREEQVPQPWSGSNLAGDEPQKEAELVFLGGSQFIPCSQHLDTLNFYR